MRKALVSISAFFSFALLGMAACQGSPPEIAEASPIVVPSLTASPIPPSATPSPTPSPTAPLPTASATLAPFPEEALNGALKRLNPETIKAANSNAPLALLPSDHFYFSYPIANAEANRRTPSFRYGKDQDREDGAGHTGLDVGGDNGTTILAAAEGRVIFSGYGLISGYENPDDPYGIAIAIQHDFGHEGQLLYTVYAHLSISQVEVGEIVERGEQIGRSGETGLSSGAHLHFEVRLGKNDHYNSRNPELWISPPEGSGVLVGQLYTTFGARLINKAIKLTNLETGRIHWAYSYEATINVLKDDYFDENFVLGDLPAGRYEIAVPYVFGTIKESIEIHANAITYFSFRGTNGFQFDLPAIEYSDYLPQ